MKSALYGKDFLKWTEEQAAVLRTGNLSALDAEHLLEEIEDMGNELRNALESCLRKILVHLVKLKFSPAVAPRNKWQGEVINFRVDAQRRIKKTPSLKSSVDKLFAEAWEDARIIAIKEFEAYGEQVVLPEECPFTLGQTLDADFLPLKQEKETTMSMSSLGR